MAKDKKCAHPSCNCRANDKSDYCSTYCEGAGKMTEIGCNCGHDECSVGAGTAPVER